MPGRHGVHIVYAPWPGAEPTRRARRTRGANLVTRREPDRSIREDPRLLLYIPRTTCYCGVTCRSTTDPESGSGFRGCTPASRCSRTAIATTPCSHPEALRPPPGDDVDYFRRGTSACIERFPAGDVTGDILTLLCFGPPHHAFGHLVALLVRLGAGRRNDAGDGRWPL